MKRSAGKMFIRIFFRSFIIIGILFLAGVLSYKAIKFYWQPQQKEDETVYQEDSTGQEKELIDKHGVSKNLIYCIDEKTGDITRLVLEIFDSKDSKLTYITIPTKTQLTLSDSLYQKLNLDDPEIPQLIKLSTITKYLDGSKAYEDELRITEELLKTEINYYTAIPEKTYVTMFTQQSVKPSKQYDALVMEVFTGEYKRYLRALDSKDKLEAYLSDIYPELKSDITLEDRIGLLDYYNKDLFDNLSFQLLPGNNLNNEYVTDPDAAAQQLDKASGTD